MSEKTLRAALEELLTEVESGIATCPLTRDAARAALAAPVETAQPGPWHDWHDWTGGECPVAGEVWVDVELRGGNKPESRKAGKLHWDSLGYSTDIIAWRYAAVTPVAVSDAALDAKGIRDAALDEAAMIVSMCTPRVIRTNEQYVFMRKAEKMIRSLKSGGLDREATNE